MYTLYKRFGHTVWKIWTPCMKDLNTPNEIFEHPLWNIWTPCMMKNLVTNRQCANIDDNLVNYFLKGKLKQELYSYKIQMSRNRKKWVSEVKSEVKVFFLLSIILSFKEIIMVRFWCTYRFWCTCRIWCTYRIWYIYRFWCAHRFWCTYRF